MCRYTEVCPLENRTMICSSFVVLVLAIHFVWHCVLCEYDVCYLCGGNTLNTPCFICMYLCIVHLTFHTHTHTLARIDFSSAKLYSVSRAFAVCTAMLQKLLEMIWWACARMYLCVCMCVCVLLQGIKPYKCVSVCKRHTV